jgi:predicted DCC family thiol-disulfide oxidoreductase YuxK
MNLTEGKILIQFDGNCVLCSRTVRFLLKVDRKRRFVFQTLDDQSKKISETVVVIDGSDHFQYFDAVLKLAKELGGIYRIAEVFRILPASWRKSLYLWVARNRYRWFGRRKNCYLPSASESDRFISKSNSSFSN